MSQEDVEVKLARIEVHLSQLTTQLAQISAALTGSNEAPGMVVRLDRLEQAESRRAKLVWLAISAAITALVKGLLP